MSKKNSVYTLVKKYFIGKNILSSEPLVNNNLFAGGGFKKLQAASFPKGSAGKEPTC